MGEAMEEMVTMVESMDIPTLVSTMESMASVRPRLILTSTMVPMGELVTMVESMATPILVSTMESMASVKLRLRLILTSTTESMVELVTMVESTATPTLASTMESMASVRLRLSPMSMDSPTLLDSAMPTPPTSDMESTMAKQIIWGFPEFDHLTKHCGYHKQ